MPFIKRRNLLNSGRSILSNPGSYGPLVWIDTSDTSTLFQERTGASATTPSSSDGNPVGTIVNKGSLPLYFITDNDSRRATWKSNISTISSNISSSLGGLLFDGVDDGYYAQIQDSNDYSCIADGYSMVAVHRYINNDATGYSFEAVDRKEITPGVSVYCATSLCANFGVQVGGHFVRLPDSSSGFIYN